MASMRLILLLIRSTIVFSVLIFQNAVAQETMQQTIARINDTTVTVVTGDLDSTGAKLTQDLAVMLNNGEKQRVLPVLGLDAVSVVSDVLHLRGVDIGIVHEDSLAMIGKDRVFPRVRSRIQYISKLFRDNIYIIASRSIANLKELEGKKVNFGPGSDSPYTTPALLFKALGIDVQPTNIHHEPASRKIRSGEIAATVIVGGRLDEIAAKLRVRDGGWLLPIPGLEDSTFYTPVTVTSEEYPGVLPANSRLTIVSVGSVLIVNNWPETHKRHQKVARFVEAFFDRFKELLQDGYLPQWQEVNLAAQLPNWRRFPPAQSWLDTWPGADPSALEAIQEQFADILTAASTGSVLTTEEKAQLYYDFLGQVWRKVEAKVTVRLTLTEGVGKVIGTITAMNSEILVAGRKEPALLLTPDLQGLRPGPYALHIHENPDCGPAAKDGKMVAGLGAGSHLWLTGTGQFSGATFSSHLGDLPDLQVDADGTATKGVVAPRLTLADAVNRSLMIHASQDDNAPRMACGALK